MSQTLKTVIVDASPLSSASPTGISNFTFLALKSWAEQARDIQFYLSAPAPINSSFFAELSKLKNIDQTKFVGVKTSTSRLGRGFFWFLTKLPVDIYRCDADLFWSPAVIFPPLIKKPRRVLLTIYDLVPIKFYATMKPVSRILYRFLFQRSIARADILWAISDYAKNELHSTLPTTALKPIYIGCAADHYTFKFSETFKQVGRDYLHTQMSFSNDDRLFLFVGSLEPRKNLSHLIRMLPEFNRRKWKLIVVGGSSWGSVFSESDKQLIQRYSEHVVFLKRIENDLLCKIYHAVDLFISPSLNEGFCLPALEAMLCGTPVVLANNSAMTEIIGSAGVLIDGYDEQVWVKGIETALSKNFNPREQAKKYDWTAIGQNVNAKIKETI